MSFQQNSKIVVAPLPTQSVEKTYSAFVFDTVVPETWGRELLSDDYSHAVY